MPNTAIESKGFFASLFDFGFTSFITLKFLRVIYAVGVVSILLTGTIFIIAGISQGGVYSLLAIVVVPLVTLGYLIAVRISMEVVAMFFRIGDNTATMAAAAGTAGPSGNGFRSTPAGGYSTPAASTLE